MVNAWRPEHPCPNHHSACVPRAYGDQSIHTQTIIPLMFADWREAEHPCSNQNSAHVLRSARTRAKTPAKFPETSLRGSRFFQKNKTRPSIKSFENWGPNETTVNYSVFRLAHVLPEIKPRQDVRSERGLGVCLYARGTCLFCILLCTCSCSRHLFTDQETMNLRTCTLHLIPPALNSEPCNPQLQTFDLPERQKSNPES